MVSPKRPNMTISTRKMKKIIFAIDAAPSAIPVKPKIAAMIAITRKIAVHLSMILFFRLLVIYRYDYDLFLPASTRRSTITITTAITIKIPKPIPALKIPAMALHELSNRGIKIIDNSLR
jgi:hypothetical protein